jgi:hypothetical protein
MPPPATRLPEAAFALSEIDADTEVAARRSSNGSAVCHRCRRTRIRGTVDAAPPAAINRRAPKRTGSNTVANRGSCKSFVLDNIALSTRCRFSSAVEQRFCKPKVGSSILSTGTNVCSGFLNKCSPAFQDLWNKQAYRATLGYIRQRLSIDGCSPVRRSSSSPPLLMTKKRSPITPIVGP